MEMTLLSQEIDAASSSHLRLMLIMIQFNLLISNADALLLSVIQSIVSG